jgi:hypothetical protein
MPAMVISVTEPIGWAIERTKRILFQPFDLGKWFTLGFCAFLAQLGQGGGGGGGGSNWTGGGPQDLDLREMTRWVNENFTLVVAIGVCALVLLLAISALFLWLGSRGEFMFLDGVAKNRGAVREPWARFRSAGNRLFAFRFLLAVIVILTWAIAAVAMALVVWPNLERGPLSDVSWGSLVLIVGLAMLPTLAIVAVEWLLHNFVIPTMYLRGGGVMGAWRITMSEVITGRSGTIFLYFLMRVVLAIVVGILAVLLACATCCIAALPYIGTVILLPLYVFSRSYNLLFLEQLGENWQFFQSADEPDSGQALSGS